MTHGWWGWSLHGQPNYGFFFFLWTGLEMKVIAKPLFPRNTRDDPLGAVTSSSCWPRLLSPPPLPPSQPPLPLVSKVVRAETCKRRTRKRDRILTSARIDERHQKHETGQRVPERPFLSPHSRAEIRARPRFGSGWRLAEDRLGGGGTLFFPKMFSNRGGGGGGGGEAGAARWAGGSGSGPPLEGAVNTVAN